MKDFSLYTLFKLVPEGLGEVLFKKNERTMPVLIIEKKNVFSGIICASLK